jgi:hypothetical protein
MDLGSARVGLADRETYLTEAKFFVVVQSHNQALLFGQVIDCCRYTVLELQVQESNQAIFAHRYTPS